MPRKKATPPPADAALALRQTITAIEEGTGPPPKSSLIARMQELLPVEEIAQKVRDLIYATRVNAAGHEVADTRAVEIGLRYYFHYTIGLPVQRSETIIHNIGEVDDLMDRAEQSPALLRSIKRTVAAIEERHGAGETPETGNNPT